MRLSSLTQTTLNRADGGLRAKYLGIVEMGSEELPVTVSLSNRDELVVSGTSLRPFGYTLSDEDDRRSKWSVWFSMVSDVTPMLIRPMPTAVDAGVGEYDSAVALTLGGQLAAFGLFIAGAALKRLDEAPKVIAPAAPTTPEARRARFDAAVARLGSKSGKAIEDDTGLSHGYVQRTLKQLRESKTKSSAQKLQASAS